MSNFWALIALILLADLLPARPNVPPTPPLPSGSWLVTAYMNAPDDENLVRVGKTIHLHIVGVYSDGSEHNVENRYVYWFCNPKETKTPGAIAVDQQGVVTGLKPGVANVNAAMRIARNDHPIYSNAWTVTVTNIDFSHDSSPDN